MSHNGLTVNPGGGFTYSPRMGSLPPITEQDVLTLQTEVAKRLESDPSGKPLNTPGAKADLGKLRPWLFYSGFASALEEVAKVTTIGAEKYTPNGWTSVPDGEARYMEAFARHMNKYAKGEILDNGEGGIGTYHMAQMIWNLLATFELQLRNAKPVAETPNQAT